MLERVRVQVFVSLTLRVPSRNTQISFFFSLHGVHRGEVALGLVVSCSSDRLGSNIPQSSLQPGKPQQRGMSL